MLWYVASFFSFAVGVHLFASSRHGAGWVREKLIAYHLKRKLTGDSYTILNDVTLDLGDDTTQIDHLVLSTFGIFVIETKNIGGWVFGSERAKVWTQVYYRMKRRFQNPLRQNYKHKKAVLTVTSLPEEKILDLVSFPKSTEFKADVPAKVILGAGELAEKLSQIKKKVLAEDQVRKAVQAIEQSRLKPGFATDFKHLSNLSRRHEVSWLEFGKYTVSRGLMLVVAPLLLIAALLFSGADTVSQSSDETRGQVAASVATVKELDSPSLKVAPIKSGNSLHQKYWEAHYQKVIDELESGDPVELREGIASSMKLTGHCMTYSRQALKITQMDIAPAEQTKQLHALIGNITYDDCIRANSRLDHWRKAYEAK